MKFKIGDFFEVEGGELKEFFQDWKSAKNFTILSLIFIFLFFTVIKYVLNEVQIFHIYLISGIALVTIGFWLNGRRPPLNRPNKIGILIWIDSESDKDSIQIKKDFTKTFIDLLKTSKHQSMYHVVFLDRFHGKNAKNIADLDRLVSIGRFHFGLLGEIKRRHHQSQIHQFLDMQAIVKHASVDQTLSDDLRTELGTAFPQIGRASCRERVCQYV